MKPTSHLRLAASSFAVCAIVVLFSTQVHDASAVDCIGKPYGYPGCPTVTQSSSVSSVPPRCGDGAVQEQEGEMCDDGRNNGVYDCTTECQLLSCGDGKVSPQAGEECEPEVEQVYVNDPQTGQLKLEKQFVSRSCGTYCTAPANGQGGCKLKFASACSSQSSTANVQTVSTSSGTPSSVSSGVSTASLSVSSTAFSGASSSVSSNSAQPVAAPTCGDGIRQFNEECDDANDVDTDICSNTCTLSSCGDGARQLNEECDDGNRNNLDQCSNVCTLTRCGDGVLNAGEECDDGNQTGSDSCTNSCKLPRCGDGVQQQTEECDDGNILGGDSCLPTCRLSECGDGVQEGLEQCDDGNRDNFDTCTNNCRIPRCGNSVVEGAEQCDDGPRNSDTTKNACRMNCRAAYCGDRVMDTGEECDGGAECSSMCQKTGPVTATIIDPNTRTNSTIVIQAIVGALVILGSIIGYLFRRKLLALVGIKRPAKDIDDIPLDQIEMPWNKW